MADISQEIEKFRTAAKGEEVRSSMISVAEKVNAESSEAISKVEGVEEATEAALEAAETASDVAATVQAKLDNGELKGDKGDKGDRGIQGPVGAIDKNSAVEFNAYSIRENIVSGDLANRIFGKIQKFFTDLKTVAFTGNYSDLVSKPTIVNNLTHTASGNALDARQGKVLKEAIDDLTSSDVAVNDTDLELKGTDVQTQIGNHDAAISNINVDLYQRDYKNSPQIVGKYGDKNLYHIFVEKPNCGITSSARVLTIAEIPTTANILSIVGKVGVYNFPYSSGTWFTKVLSSSKNNITFENNCDWSTYTMCLGIYFTAD